MKKVIKTTFATTALLTSVGTLRQVKADDISTPNKSQTGQEKLTKDIVEQAIEQASKTQAAVNSQEKVVKEAEKSVKEASEVAKNAASTVTAVKENVDKTTAENKAKTEAALNAANKKVETQTAAEKAAATKLNDTKAQKTAAEREAAEKEAAEKIARAEASEAQVKATQAQKNVDGTGATVAEAALKKAQKQVEADQIVVDNKTTALRVAQEADSSRQANINQASAVKAQAQKTVEVAIENVRTADTEAQSTTNILKEAEAKFKTAQNAQRVHNTLTLSPEYFQALKVYRTAQNTADQIAALDVLKRINKNLREQNTYIEDPTDSKVKYDTNNLPEYIRREATLLAVDLINQVRRQAGTPQVVANKSAIDLAEAVGKEYLADNWTWRQVASKGHDAVGINRAARRFGLKPSTPAQEAAGQQFYENMMTYTPTVPQLSLADAKKICVRVYDGVYAKWL